MKLLKIKLLVIALVMFAASSAFASLSFNESFNTTSLEGQSGYIYLQYVPVNAAASTATVSGFTTDGVLGAQSFDVVDGAAVTGALPGSVVFANTNGVNDYNNAITFGTTVSFLLTFSSPAAGGQAGGSSTFSMSFFQDAGGMIPLWNINGYNGSVPGTAYIANLNDDGTATGGPVVPIPAAALLLAPGLMGLIGVRTRIKK